MRKFIPIIDILVYGSLALFSIIATIIAFLTPQEWPLIKIIIALIVPVGFITLAAIVFISKWTSRPDYITDQGTAIWSGGISNLSEQFAMAKMSAALHFFATELPKMVPGITSETLNIMLNQAKIDWKNKSLTLVGIGWTVKDKAGLQDGNGIMLYWNGSIIHSALFHELFHMVDELVLHKAPDYKHENTGWWEIATELENMAEKQNITRETFII